MKKLLFVLLITILAGCNSQKKYTDYDYSFARSGGFAPVYENLLIKGTNAHYSFEGRGQKIKKDFTVSAEELAEIETALTQYRFRTIQEDYQKLYDHIIVEINVKKGKNAASKSNASQIMKKDEQRWNSHSPVSVEKK